MTLLFVGCTWILFRADSIQEAAFIFRHMLYGITEPVNYMKIGYRSLGIDRAALIRIIGMLAVLLTFDFLSLKRDIMKEIRGLSTVWRIGIYLIFVNVMLIFYFLYSKDSSSFIYFQF